MNAKNDNWIKKHRFESVRPQDLSALEINRIKEGLNRFKAANPTVSIVIPVYNEEDSLLMTLSSLSELEIPEKYPAELLIVNDGSEDKTQDILDYFNINSIRLNKNAGRANARQTGLENARGKYIIQADGDTLYPPKWGLSFVESLKDHKISMAYGDHAFISKNRTERLILPLHLTLGNMLYFIRKRNREYMNVHGFNSAFRKTDGLNFGTYEYGPNGSEDGSMAIGLMRIGRLRFVSGADSTAWTSTRRIYADGGLFKGILRRLKREVGRLFEYLFVKKIPSD